MIGIFVAAQMLCAAVAVDAPYQLMSQGFETRDAATVARAFEAPMVMGTVEGPTVRATKDDIIATFGYVAREDGRTLNIDFKIIHRDQTEKLVSDVGFYRITDAQRGPGYGRFNTMLTCGEDGQWRIKSDVMTRSDEAAWDAASCVEDTLCSE